MLPELKRAPGLVKAMRAAWIEATPGALFLTSLSHIDGWVEGLEAGGDNFSSSPSAFYPS